MISLTSPISYVLGGDRVIAMQQICSHMYATCPETVQYALDSIIPSEVLDTSKFGDCISSGVVIVQGTDRFLSIVTFSSS